MGAVPEMIKAMVDSAIQEQRNRYLNVEEYERQEERQGYVNGFKPRTVYTRVGKFTFDILQVREG